MQENNSKALPKITPLSSPFWRGTRNGKLLLQRCDQCQRFQFYPRPWCRFCGSSKYTWTEVAGRGTVYSFTIPRQVIANVEAFEPDIPFVVALVQLDEEPRIISNIVNCRLENVHIGMKVEVLFEKASQQITLPKFKPAAQSGCTS